MSPDTKPSAAEHAHTNALIHATSPYLLQHAHNPVNWYPWGEEALSKARAEDKPIFLSIGYSACHWCHVMERESFENEEIARFLNEHFVSIKVDREERPDLDEIYMSATMIANQGQGGWPMSVFLRPDLKPFFAGTYFPPESRYGRPGFLQLLQYLARLWESDRGKIDQGAEALTSAVLEQARVAPGEHEITREVVSPTAALLARHFDRQKGGMLSGGTNKFPPSTAMGLMLREHARTAAAGKPNADLLYVVELTLDRMSRGGIYDHLGGGIARYSTDPDWLVPHFEKMLYDQAQVAGIYLDAFQATGNSRWADVARDILDYVLADLQSPEGGFYSARDADSEGVEGKYYVWSWSELRQLLGEPDVKLFASYYDCSEAGNWEGNNILHLARLPEETAKVYALSVEALEARIEPMREKLRAVRAKRVPPGLDDKILCDWNGLMISSLARGAAILDEQRYAEAAAKAADFILARMSREGRLLRAYRGGKAHTPGYLTDYAFLIEGLLHLYEATFDPRWLESARALNEKVIRHFHDQKEGGFFFIADDAEQLLVRTKDAGDGAIPSGNSVQLLNLARLALIYDRADWREKSEQTLRTFAEAITTRAGGYDRLLWAVDFVRGEPHEIVIVGAANDPGARALLAEVRRRFLPNSVVMAVNPTDAAQAALAERIPLLRGKTLIDGRPAAYVCRNYACRAPVTTPADLAKQL